MGRSGPRRPSLMDNAYSTKHAPLTPGEVEIDLEEKKPQVHQKQAPSPGAVRGPSTREREQRAVKFTSEPAAALKLIDTEKRGCGTCLAPLPYRAQDPIDSQMMNPFAKPWSPQVGQCNPCIGVIQQPMQQMPQPMQQPMPQIQQGMPQQPMLGQPMNQPMGQQPMYPQSMPQMGQSMPQGAVPCFYATPIQVAAPYTTMAPYQPPHGQVSMVMVQNPGSSPAQAEVGPVGPIAPSPLAPIGPGPIAPSPPLAPIGPVGPQHHGAGPPVHGTGPAQGEPPLGSSELPSKGSALHAFRACKPCAFFYQEGCSNKEQCAFCHLCEPGERKRRKKERRMARREAQEG